jgi:hypothetical protein
VTAERGAHFHPIVGSLIPIGFTTSHPRAGPQCFETQSTTSHSLKVNDEDYFPSPLLITHCIFQSSYGSPSAILVTGALLCPLQPPPPQLPHYFPCLFSVRFHVAQISLFNGQVWELLRMGSSPPPPSPSFTLEEPPHLPYERVIHLGV